MTNKSKKIECLDKLCSDCEKTECDVFVRSEVVPSEAEIEKLTGIRHNLKTWPIPFQAVLDGTKTAEYRKNDRRYEVGDILLLEEYLPDKEYYTGRTIEVKVSHIVYGNQFGIPNDYCVMSILPLGYRLMPEKPELKPFGIDELIEITDRVCANHKTQWEDLFDSDVEQQKIVMEMITQAFNEKHLADQSALDKAWKE